MGFPYPFHENFESGGNGLFNSETDTGNRLRVMHYTELVQSSGHLPLPYRGAYALVVDSRTGSNADAYLLEAEGFDTALGGTIYQSFVVMITPDMIAKNGDTVRISGMNDASAVEMDITVGLHFSDLHGWRVYLETRDTGFNDAYAFQVPTGEYFHVTVHNKVDSGANDGTATLYINGRKVGSTRTGITQGAIVDMRIGSFNQSSTIRNGLIILDDVYADSTRPFPLGLEPRWPFDDPMLEGPPFRSNSRFVGPSPTMLPMLSDLNARSTIHVPKNAHVFVGPGRLDAASVVASSSGAATMTLYDTDRRQEHEGRILAILSAATSLRDEIIRSLNFQYGCYAVFTGTNPRGVVSGWAQYQSKDDLASYAQGQPKPSDDDV